MMRAPPAALPRPGVSAFCGPCPGSSRKTWTTISSQRVRSKLAACQSSRKPRAAASLAIGYTRGLPSSAPASQA